MSGNFAVGIALAVVALVPFAPANAGKDTIVYSFTGGIDGASPTSGFVADGAGNLYSTTAGGGSFGQGTVFEITPGGAETVLYSFTGGSDGASPQAGLVRDAAGNLFGTTLEGGANALGTVFMLAPDGTEKVLHSFQGGNLDGANPLAGLVADGKGSFYGTTEDGGSQACGAGCGTVFKISRTGKLKIIHYFEGSPDGADPIAGVVADAAGNLYGTTLGGGEQSDFCGVGCGTVFELSPAGKNSWTETLPHSFQPGGSDGINPGAGLFVDGKGNLYGTTTAGGNLNDCIADQGCGTVFELSRAGGGWIETVLYAFKGGSDGSSPYAGLIQASNGNLFGATFEGGLNNCPFSSGCGTVFELTRKGDEKVVHAFNGPPSDGANSQSALFSDGKGNLYGTTVAGGATKACFENQGCGTVFRLKQ